jgi:DNA-binding IclR family transcriptional regulator
MADRRSAAAQDRSEVFMRKEVDVWPWNEPGSGMAPGSAAEEARSSSIHSAEVCLKVLKALMEADGPKTLTELSALSGISLSKSHRHLQTLINAGFASQNRRSGRYDLGSMAMELGYAALERVDLVNRTSDHLEDLAAATSCHAHLSVWSERGPVLVRMQCRGRGFESVDRLGARRPLWNSATGNVFLAFLARHITQRCLEIELEYHHCPPTAEEINDRIQDVRNAGFAQHYGTISENLVSLAAPVIDVENNACAVVTLIRSGNYSLGENDPIIEYLLNFCREMSVFNAPLYRRLRPDLAAQTSIFAT